ncbi:MAG: YifB family Mg chelatase-like AAA ATPase [Eubacterium sp.]|nr:YifB family Mg chelatase-like AAA ATPase [Eubacterium sp.]
MVAETLSGMVSGVTGLVIRVQTDISEGLPIMNMIGDLAPEVREAKERVRTALRNTGFHIPPKRIAVNLAPADLRKSGPTFDLAIAVSLLSAMGFVDSDRVAGILFLGELSLDGSLMAVPGVLPLVMAAAAEGIECCGVPAGNYQEAMLPGLLRVEAFENLDQVCAFLNREDCGKGYMDGSGETFDEINSEWSPEQVVTAVPDFSSVHGQRRAKRALEIAAAGFHNVLLDGPPGVGKSMLASCIPGIMPRMTEEEMIDTTMIYSVKGLLRERFRVVRNRPFRSPGHATTMAGMFGGGQIPKPGEISLAHHGVLFLDELPEYPRALIENFRIPLEAHEVMITRRNRLLSFPADFLLAAAANPCPCGYYPDRRKCSCTEQMIRRYRSKLSGPILDRIDLYVRCERLNYDSFQADSNRNEETSDRIRKRVEMAWELQQERASVFNGRMSQDQIRHFCRLDAVAEGLMKKAYEKLELTGRSYYRILKVARTIADLEGRETVDCRHLEEALSYRDGSTAVM